MLRSGVSPAVKRSKFARVMPRRAASGHSACDAIAEIGGRGADGVRRHQRIARGAGLPAPLRLARSRREPSLPAGVETGASASCRAVARGGAGDSRRPGSRASMTASTTKGQRTAMDHGP